ncbi:MAG: hypothetical protein AB8G99_01270 [Planctomycetaceae bacterium]
MDKVRQALHDFTNGQTLSGEQIVHLLLVATLVAATVHLITMLATRWGDKHIGPKSLAASILVHAVCLLGLTSSTAFDVMPLAKADSKKDREERVQIRNVVVESEREIKKQQFGNVPVYEKVQEEQDLARVDRKATNYEPTQIPERETQKDQPTELVMDDIADPNKTPEVASMPEDAGVEGPRQTANATIQSDDSVEQARSEVTPNTPSRTARSARAGNPDKRTTREVPRGSVSRIEDTFEANDVSPEMQRSESGEFAATEKPADVVSSPTGPVPARTEIDEPGAETEKGSMGGAGVLSAAQIAAMRARRARRDGRAKDEPRVQRDAQTEIPLQPGFDVRESPAVNPLADSMEFVPAPEVMSGTSTQRRPSVPATYQLRSLDSRKAVARQNGGTEESEKAVERSLQWLASAQRPTGNWSSREHGGGRMLVDKRADGLEVNLSKNGDRPAGARADTGVTALSVLAFLGAGYTHEEGDYTDVVGKAIRWLISQQDDEGCLAGNATYFARNYCHAMVTYALAEAMGMQNDPQSDPTLRLAVMRAIAYTSGQQNQKTGGWRYIKDQPGDMSMFGWQMMALKSSEIAGAPIADVVKQRMNRFLKGRRQGRYGGLAGYRSQDPPDKTMTAEAMFCRIMLGYPRDGEDMREAVGYLLRRGPRRADVNFYYWYYGTLSMFQYGGRAWDTWNEEVRELLIDEQVKDGEFAGTWDPKRTRWGKAGGRVYTTALATLTLEVYYRFLPLYRAAAPPDLDASDE